jgi:hypothetical protein
VTCDAPTSVRLQLLDGHTAAIAELDAKEKVVTARLHALVDEAGSTLGELCGLSTRSAAELLVEVGDPRRFTEGGLARFKAPPPCRRLRAKDPASPSVTASTGAVTAASMPFFTAWPSRSDDVILVPRNSLPTPAEVIPRRRPCASSSDS